MSGPEDNNTWDILSLLQQEEHQYPFVYKIGKSTNARLCADGLPQLGFDAGDLELGLSIFVHGIFRRRIKENDLRRNNCRGDDLADIRMADLS